MKAVVIHATGGPEQLVLADCPIPCRPRRSAARRGLCRLQLGRQQVGWHLSHPMTYPMVLGFEVSGTVTALGPASRAWRSVTALRYSPTRRRLCREMRRGGVGSDQAAAGRGARRGGGVPDQALTAYTCCSRSTG